MRKLLLGFFVFILIILAFNYYFKSSVKTNSNGDWETVYEPIQKYKKEKIVTKDTIYYSQPAIFLISDGGRIEASCNNGYKILVESQNNESSSSYSRIYYSFRTKDEYKEAISYIKKKGFRWIVNHQYSAERKVKWNLKPDITWDKNDNQYASIYLTDMHFSE